MNIGRIQPTPPAHPTQGHALRKEMKNKFQICKSCKHKGYCTSYDKDKCVCPEYKRKKKK